MVYVFSLNFFSQLCVCVYVRFCVRASVCANKPKLCEQSPCFRLQPHFAYPFHTHRAIVSLPTRCFCFIHISFFFLFAVFLHCFEFEFRCVDAEAEWMRNLNRSLCQRTFKNFAAITLAFNCTLSPLLTLHVLTHCLSKTFHFLTVIRFLCSFGWKFMCETKKS